ncbi:MAG: leucyl/phenylalanyl-tRNA--protein transferase [Hyphomicrobiales bacterium]
MTPITPQILLKAYAAGIFPMAESADDDALYWIDPDKRGILPLDAFHLPRRLRRTVRAAPFDIKVDNAFSTVIEACAGSAPGRESTWINPRIRSLYEQLHRMGFCHTVEAWQDDELAGGLYGVKIGAAFFGESMFSRTRDASKVALVHLVARLIAGGFELLDTQFVTEHLSRFGTVEVSREDYHARLEHALQKDADFYSFDGDGDPEAVLQLVSQMS